MTLSPSLRSISGDRTLDEASPRSGNGAGSERGRPRSSVEGGFALNTGTWAHTRGMASASAANTYVSMRMKV